MAELVYRDDAAEVWLGDCLNADDCAQVMGERKADLLCLDAPYSEKTHEGHKNGKLTADRAATFARAHANDPSPESRYSARKSAAGESGRRDISYDAWATEHVHAFADVWLPLTAGWLVSITDDVLAPAWRSSFEANDRYTFAPLPLVESGSRVRMTGDGPSNWSCWIVVARPRSRAFASWGTLPGAYIQPAEREFNSSSGTDRVVGGKPLKSMIAIVGDYSRRGALVVDPTCGGGTTLVAAKASGRRSIGIDSKPEHCEIAARRLRDSREQRSLFA